MTTPPTRPSARPLLTVAVTALLLVALALAPRPDTAQAAPHTDQPIAAAVTDSLWAAGTDTGNNNHQSRLGACATPTSSQSLASCFSPSSLLSWQRGQGGPFDVNAMTSSGNTVVIAGGGHALSCPVSGSVGNCTEILSGALSPPKSDNDVLSLTANDQWVWLGTKSGLIYRCPTSTPDTCVELDDAGKRKVTSLVFANNRLYAGLANYGIESKKQGLLWSCDPHTANSCTTLDSYGATTANSLVAGGGYLWAGLDNGIIWRCDPQQANACTNWETSGGSITSLSYDGNNTLYAGVKRNAGGVVWSCPLTPADNCATVVSRKSSTITAVAAAPRTPVTSGGCSPAPCDVFWSDSDGISYGQQPFTSYNGHIPDTDLLSVPADGPLGVGGVSVKVVGIHRLRSVCTSDNGKQSWLRLRLTATGRQGLVSRRIVNLCRAHRTGTKTTTVTVNRLLDPGRYIITARGAGLRTRTAVTVTKNHTTRVRLRLSPGRG